MKVALIHERVGGKAGGGGGVRQMLELGRNLQRAGHEVVIACHDFDPSPEFAEAWRDLDIRSVTRGSVSFRVTRGATLRRLWRGMSALARLVPQDADAVNAHEWPALHAGALASRRLGIPFVWTRNDETLFERAVIPDETTVSPGGLTGRLAHGLVGISDLRDARRAAAIVVLDERNARMVRRSYRREARIVRSGPARGFFDPPPRERARERLDVSEDAFLVLAFGILFPHRRLEDLVEAATALSDRDGLQVLIIGSDHADPAYADRLEALIRDRGLGSRIALRRTSLSDEDLRAAYAAADVFVFPNRRQTWGLAPLEALASGTPVVVSSGAGVHEVLAGRPGVTVVPPEDPRALADALERAISDGAPERLEETREWIRRELGNEVYARRMAEVFEEIGQGA